MTDEQITDRVGCDKCTEPNPVWETMKVTDNGYPISVCDCGRAEIGTQSVTQDTELWEFNVRRDSKGRFVGDNDD